MQFEVTCKDGTYKSWRDLQKFTKEFGAYLKFKGVSGMWEYEYSDVDQSLMVALNTSKGTYKHCSDLTKDLEKSFPKYNFEPVLD
ncbi:MAG: hypothetical protein J6U54_08750 [Clostridiales bacterium]|nr:hypothetical protein [Clostridiales bacterium]